MRNMSIIAQISLEADNFQSALDNRDKTITLEYMTMLFRDEVSSDDLDFIFAMNETGCDAETILICCANPKFNFTAMRIFEPETLRDLAMSISKIFLKMQF